MSEKYRYSRENLLAEIKRIAPGLELATGIIGNQIHLPKACQIAASVAFVQNLDSDMLRQALIDLEVDGCFNFTE